LTDAGFRILLALGERERHGYEILQALTADGERRIGPTTLYRTIRALVDVGFIEESDRRPDPELDDQRRRYYRLTGAGRRAARAEIERLRRLLAVSDASPLGAARRLQTAR
jgi:DNA-binding PadR family transcriptional regulator